MQSTSQGDLADHRRPASYGATFRQPVIIAGAAREEGPGGPDDVEGEALVRSFGCEFLGQCADDRQPRGGWSRRRDGGAHPAVLTVGALADDMDAGRAAADRDAYGDRIATPARVKDGGGGEP